MDSFDELRNSTPMLKHAGGCPSIYTDEVANTILGNLAEGKGMRLSAFKLDILDISANGLNEVTRHNLRVESKRKPSCAK